MRAKYVDMHLVSGLARDVMIKSVLDIAISLGYALTIGMEKKTPLEFLNQMKTQQSFTIGYDPKENRIDYGYTPELGKQVSAEAFVKFLEESKKDASTILVGRKVVAWDDDQPLTTIAIGILEDASVGTKRKYRYKLNNNMYYQRVALLEGYESRATTSRDKWDNKDFMF